MSANEDDIRVRIAGDLADINKALRDLKAQAAAAGREASRSSRDWGVLGRGLDSLRSQVTGLVGAYLGFRGVTAVFRGVIQNTVEAENVAAQLEARIESTGGVAGFTAEQLLDVARRLQDVTTFGDEAIASMETLLLTFTNIRGDAFTRATTAILDMAAALGTDLDSAASQVGRALQDPIRGLQTLTRAGITFSTAQRQQIKAFVETNNIAGAQGVILDELSKKFDGAAAAARNTLGGAIAALNNAFGDLLEGEGGNLQAATRGVQDLTRALQDPQMVEAFDRLVAAVLRSAGILASAVQKFTEIGQGIGIFLAQVATGTTDVDDNLQLLNQSIAQTKKELEEVAAFERELTEQGVTRVLDETTLAKIRGEREALERRLADFEFALRAARAEAERTPPASAPTPASALTPGRTPPTAAIPVDPRPALKAMQAQLAAAGKLLDDELKRVGKALDQEFADNLVRFEDYYQRRADLERRAIDQQLAAQRQALALLDEEIRLAEERGDEIEEQENKRKTLVAEITVLERQRGDVAAAAARAQLEAERNLTEQLNQVRRRLLELQGNSVAARSLELSGEFEDLLARLAAEGDAAGEELVRSLINVELARSRLAELETQYQNTLAALARAEKRVEIEVETGVISEREGRRQIIELHRETAAEVEKLIPMMRELAAATGDPESIERVKDLELEVEKLGATVNVAARELRETLRDAGEDAFSSVLDGTSKAKDALDDFIQTFRSKIADLVSERLFDKLFDVVGAGGEGGNGGFFAQLFAGLFHQGGIAGLARTFRRVPALAFAGAPRYHGGGIAGDEVPAILRKGEEVLTRSDPRHRDNLGAPTINIYAQDAQTFRRQSRGQLAADAATMLLRARNRNG